MLGRSLTSTIDGWPTCSTETGRYTPGTAVWPNRRWRPTTAANNPTGPIHESRAGGKRDAPALKTQGGAKRVDTVSLLSGSATGESLSVFAPSSVIVFRQPEMFRRSTVGETLSQNSSRSSLVNEVQPKFSVCRLVSDENICLTPAGVRPSHSTKFNTSMSVFSAISRQIFSFS